MDNSSREHQLRTQSDRGPYLHGEQGTAPKRLADGTVPRKALMNASLDLASGVVTVNCPYCLMGPWRNKIGGFANPVDVTRFVEQEGKREHKTSCSKGHTLKFRTVDEWREERQKAGIQTRA
jgi:hypothetical protein